MNAPIAELVGKAHTNPPATWVWIIVGLDVLTFGGVATWVYFCYFHKKKAKKVKGQAPSEPTSAEPVSE